MNEMKTLYRRARLTLMKRIRGAHGSHHRIARDMAIVMVFALVAKVAGAAKEVAVAWRYGVDEVVDAYLFVFNLVNLPISIWFNFLTVVFIPLALQLRDQPKALHQVRSETLGVTVLLGVVVGLVWYALLTYLFASSLAGLSDEARAVGLSLTPWLAMLIPLGFMIHFGSVLVMAEGRHSNTLFEGVPAVVLLIAVLTVPAAGAVPLIWGSLLGFLAHLTVVNVFAIKRDILSWPRLSFSSPTWVLFLSAARLMLVAQILQGLTIVVDQLFAARLDAGAIATLGYSDRILSLILTLGATAVSRATLPVFVTLQAGSSDVARATARRWGQLMFLLGIVVLVAGWPSARLLVQMIFERGAFSSSDAEAVADVLRYGLVQIPFYFAALVLIQRVISMRRYGIVAALAFGNLTVKISVNAFLVPLLGLKGLMLSTAAMYLFGLFALTILLRRTVSLPGVRI